MAFPTTPTNGQQALVNGITYTYASVTNSWVRVPIKNYTASVNPPASPTVGSQWYNTTTNVLYEYLNDGTSSYWVDIQTPSVSANITVPAGIDVLNPFLLAGM